MVKPNSPPFADNTPANSADSLDGDVLGEEPGDHGLPGVNQFTDRTILNSEDPAIIMGGSEIVDDMKTRVWREMPDEIDVAEDGGFRLVDLRSGDSGEPELADQEASLIGKAKAAPRPVAEEAALRVDKR
jgi:hypothetical protein